MLVHSIQGVILEQQDTPFVHPVHVNTLHRMCQQIL